MKRNDFIEIKSLDQRALIEKVRVLRGEISDLVIDKAMNKLTDLKVISKKRKDIAKILTVLTQKQLLEKLEKQVQEISEKSVKSDKIEEPVKVEKTKKVVKKVKKAKEETK